MDLDRINIEYSKVKNLHQYRNYTEQELRKLAYSRAIEYHTNIGELFVDDTDKKLAKSLLKKYLNDYSPETISDINTLRSIIYLEILNNRFQTELNEKHKAKKDVNPRTVETIHKNINEILLLKASLGITKDKKDGNVKEADKRIDLLKKQFKVWLRDNQASRTTCCPYCGQLFLLRIRREHWEAQKHPFFKDRILYNKTLINLYLEGVITKENLAEILECSLDYIDWVIERVHKDTEKT